MSQYWESTSAPTTAGQQFVRLPAPQESSWEWARLLDELRPEGYARAVVRRPNDYGVMIDTNMVIQVWDCLLYYTTLTSGTIIKADFHRATNRWWYVMKKCSS